MTIWFNMESFTNTLNYLLKREITVLCWLVSTLSDYVHWSPYAQNPEKLFKVVKRCYRSGEFLIKNSYRTRLLVAHDIHPIMKKLVWNIVTVLTSSDHLKGRVLTLQKCN